jgi:hydrogenase 3 maturation protease
MLSLKKTLKSKLKDARRVAILGVGSDLRGDDVAGILVAEQFSKQRPKVNQRVKVRVFIGATAPENLSGQIKKFNPTHLVIVDSADLDKLAGQVRLIERQELDGISFCTHRLPLKVMVDYLTQSIGCATIIIGIQPKTISFGSRPSKVVERAAAKVYSMIKEVLSSVH